jgi:AcrR family transcriptional regulator
MATRRPGSTRERLLDVALDLFAEEGFRGTTITEVERRAGLTPGTGSFYRHFASKEDLLRAAVDREVERGMVDVEASRAAAPTLDDPRAQEAQQLELLLQDIRRFDRVFRLLFTEGDRVPELRDAITTALKGPGDQVTWADDPLLVLRIVALTGYHLLTALPGSLVDGVPEQDFLRALARLGVE